MADKNDKTGAMQVDIDLVRQLAAVLDDTQLTEIEVEDGERRVRVARTLTSGAPVHYAPAPVAAAAPAAGAAAPAAEAPAPSTALTVPPAGAWIGFITFIASMISSVCPALTLSPTLMNGSAPGSEVR